MRADDAELVVGWRNEEATASMFFLPPPTLEEHRAWFEGPRKGRVDYVIIRRDLNRRIGVVNLRNIDEKAHIAEAGKLIGDHRSRGQGMAKESFAAWLLYGFRTLGLHRVVVRTRSDNTANVHLNRRLGFEVESRHEQQAADGHVHTFLTMAIDRKTVEQHHYFRTIDRQGYFRLR